MDVDDRLALSLSLPEGQARQREENKTQHRP
jgi:hypothetical protein